MAESNKIRISKVLKEFNIGLQTLVEFLTKKGEDVESNPNAKISNESYEFIKEEFGADRELKDKSKDLAIQKKKNADDLVSVDVNKKDVEEAREEMQEAKEVIVKVTTTEKQQFKIVDKIDLSATKKRTEKKEEQPTVAPKTDAPSPVGSKKEFVQKPKEKIVVDKPKEKEVDIKIDVEKLAGPKIIENIKIEDRKSKKKETLQPKGKAKVEPKAQPKVESKVEKIEVKPQVEEQHKGELKKEELEKNTSSTAENFIPTTFQKLSGPVLTGEKVDLRQFERPKPDNNKKEQGKRKRVRSNKVKVDVETEKRTVAPKTADQAKKDKAKKPKKDFRPPVRREVDNDAVQRQVKETLARLTENKGKTKSSRHRRDKREAVNTRMQEAQEIQKQESTTLKVTEFVTASELANMMNVPVTKVIEACMNLGLMVSINQRLDAEALVLVAEEFGYKIDFVSADIQAEIKTEEDKPEDLLPRPPIVTVMGHVDHGKTSLLDNIRNTNVIAGEAGGITQHIGAYKVKLPNGRRITFLDTPGHEAFTAMRARGAKVTDVAIIIIAADDAVMPQTKEAINHAMAAGVPMVFAINKIDKPGAQSEKIKEQLAGMNILVEDWGGKYQCQEISAKKGLNLDKLLDKVLLEADMLELTANPNKRADGSVIESSLDKGRGYVATVLVQGGTLKVGDALLSGSNSGKIKAMFNERGQRVDTAGPSSPVIVLGLNGAPAAGETFNVLEDEREAREVANKREQLIRIQGIHSQPHVTLDEIGRRIAIGNFKELNVIIKGDVDGSIEALSDSMMKLSTEEVQVNVIHKAVGAISESDVLLAVASNAVIIGFQVRPSVSARKLAENEKIEIRLYSVIYDAINEVRDAIEGMLAPELKEEITATVEVLEIFKVPKIGTVAGGIVREGKITRSSSVRVIRDGIVVYTGNLGSLKRFKDDVKEVASGYDCGLNVENFNDIKVGDIIESYEQVEIKRKL